MKAMEITEKARWLEAETPHTHSPPNENLPEIDLGHAPVPKPLTRHATLLGALYPLVPRPQFDPIG